MERAFRAVMCDSGLSLRSGCPSLIVHRRHEGVRGAACEMSSIGGYEPQPGVTVPRETLVAERGR